MIIRIDTHAWDEGTALDQPFLAQSWSAENQLLKIVHIRATYLCIRMCFFCFWGSSGSHSLLYGLGTTKSWNSWKFITTQLRSAHHAFATCKAGGSAGARGGRGMFGGWAGGAQALTPGVLVFLGRVDARGTDSGQYG